MGQIAAVVSGKGGTGKTTLCAAVASCLAAQGRRVLCVDLDVGLRNLDISLGLASEATVTFQDVLRGSYTAAQAPEHPRIPGLHLLTAPVSESPEQVDPAAFCAMLQAAAEEYDWILLDAPAGIGAGFRLAIARADRAIVVAGADPGSLRDAACTSTLVRRDGPSDTRLVVNRVSPRLFRRIRTTVDDMMDETGLPLLGLVPEDYHVLLAAARGEPLVLCGRHGASTACLHIARRLEGYSIPLSRIR